MNKILKVILITLCVILGVLFLCFVANKINAKAINSYIDTFSEVERTDALSPAIDEYGNTFFETDRDFKIVHLTDVHIGGGFLSARTDKQVINAVAAMVSEEKPDLVIVTGDISFAVPWTGTNDNAYAHSFFIRLMERLGVPWTVTLGNHDSEKYNLRDREDVARMYDSARLEHSLFRSADVSGCGNHVITVRNGDGVVTDSFFMIDSHSYTDKDPYGIIWDYDCIKEDQIEWYSECVELYSAYNASLISELASLGCDTDYSAFTTVPSELFFHIPLREVKYAYDDYVGNGRENTEDTVYIEGHDGESDEIVYCSRADELLFETALELGSTRAMFYGHDHLNNFIFEYKGIILAYGYSIDYLAYSGIRNKGYQRGCTVITSSTGGELTIVHENYYQDKYESLYEKETVNMSKD